MTLTLDLPVDVQDALTQDARRHGRTPEQAALLALRRAYNPQNNLRDGHPSPEDDPPLSPTLALFAQWADEDRADDPAELVRRQEDGDVLLARLAENRFALRPVTGEEAA